MSSISNSNFKNNREYLISIKTEYKLLEKKFLKAREKLGKWELRANLAEEKGKSHLKSEAEGQAEIIRNDINYLTDQLMSLKKEVEKAMKAIGELPQQQLSIDPGKLLEKMNTLIGGKES